MARRAKPWYRKQTGWWMVTVRGEQLKLIEAPKTPAARELAWEAFHALMANMPDARTEINPRVASLLEAFLDWSHNHQSPETYRGYCFYLQKFDEFNGDLKLRVLRVNQVTQWLDSRPWNDTTRYNAIRSVVRALNWAVEQQLVAENPLKGMSRPRPLSRSRGLDRREFLAILRGANRAFRALLIGLRQTGARPCELRHLTWDQAADDRLIIRDHKTVGKVRKARIIPLTPRMKRLLARLRKDSCSDYVFVNTRGKPWTSDAVHRQMRRLRTKLNLAEDICTYMIRHTFGTEGIVKGTDVITLAKIMGHEDATMLHKNYAHVERLPDHMMEAMERAAGNKRCRP